MRKQEKVGLFILRIGLGSFFLLWGLDKIIAPESTVKVFEFFYKTSISINLSYIIGSVEIVFGMVFMLGLWKTITYGLGILLHGISTIATYKQLFAPFGKNHLFIAALPILAGYIALFLLRKRDKLWAIEIT